MHGANCVFTWMIVFLACVSFVPVLRASETPDYVSLLQYLDAERAWSIVDRLAGDGFTGRRSGTEGADLASEYIASYFSSIGLSPAGSDGTYRTKFTTPLWELAQMPRLALVDESGNAVQTFEYRRDFNVLPGSGEGDYSAEIVFGGYGITAEDLGYDDYAGVSARGKIVLAIVGTPPSNKLEEGNYDAPYAKAENALSHGAVALILVDTPAAPTPKYIQRSGCGCCWTIYRKLAILRGSTQFADTMLKDSGSTLSSIQAIINRELRPQSFALAKRLRVSVSVSFFEDANAYNLLGFIPGSDPEASEKVVIVGAHYDHWGKDADGSVYRGANDDASGVAVVMEIARVFSAGAKPRWSILFAAWSGEEEGLYGSYAYVDRPYFPLAGTIAYLHLDMVGYGQPLLGEVSESHAALRTVIIDSAEQLNITLQIEGYHGGSDHAVFEGKGVQNVMLIYWPDEVYHTPADVSSHVSRRNLLQTAEMVALTALKLSEATVAPMTVTATTTVPTQLTNEVSATKMLVILSVTLVIMTGVGAFYFRTRRK